MAPFDGRPPKLLVLGGGGLRREGVDDRVLAGYEDATGRDALRGAALLEAVALRSRGAVVKTVTPDDAARPLAGPHGPRPRRARPGGGLSAGTRVGR
jgi:hypothetical protein